MNISVRKAKRQECEIIHQMQRIAFAPLLEKYRDYDMSPGNEKIDQIYQRFDQSFTDYYLIKDENEIVGAIRIIRNEKENTCRVSPLFIVPEHQGRGVAQHVLYLMERIYPWAFKWKLDTILEEIGNCYLYEKVGYKQTGECEKINEKMTIVYYEKIINAQ